MSIGSCGSCGPTNSEVIEQLQQRALQRKQELGLDNPSTETAQPAFVPDPSRILDIQA